MLPQFFPALSLLRIPNNWEALLLMDSKIFIPVNIYAQTSFPGKLTLDIKSKAIGRNTILAEEVAPRQAPLVYENLIT